ncbi:MAG: PQQ-binding-like beta-propeller repeat protein [Cyclobacteriaceae bacterium]
MLNTKNILLYFSGLLFIIALIWWNLSGPAIDINTSEPGMDNRGSDADGGNEIINIGAFFELFADTDSELNDTWPRFRGPEFDNIKKSGSGLIEKFDNDPKIQWSVELGEGHAGPSVFKGKVYLLDYDEEIKADMLKCYSLKDGKELWRRWYNVNIKRNHGMSRTIPALTEDYILTIGPRSHVMCLDRETGDLRWGMDIEKLYGTEIPFWYTGQCPLIDDDKAIIAAGGSAIMIAVDCSSGEVLWEVPNPGMWKMSHSSILPWIYQGIKMYVYSAVGGVIAIGAEGELAGKVLWQSDEWSCSVVAPSPVCMPDGKVFLTAGYGAGSMVFQINYTNDEFTATKLYDYKPKDGLACEQQTPVYYDGLLYGILPKDAGPMRNQFICVDPRDTREIVWASGKTHRFGLGPYMIADGKFYILNDEGTLSIVKPDRKSFVVLDQIKVFEGHDAWAPLAIADGYLLLRDANIMYCMDIRKM